MFASAMLFDLDVLGDVSDELDLIASDVDVHLPVRLLVHLALADDITEALPLALVHSRRCAACRWRLDGVVSVLAVTSTRAALLEEHFDLMLPEPFF